MNLASSLNLTPSALKSQTIGSRSFRISISPNNGSTFQGLSKLSIQLPSMVRTYANLKSAVLRGKIKCINPATDTDAICYMDKNIYSMIDRCEIQCNNQVLDNIPAFNVLVHSLSDLSSSALNTTNYDTILSGGDSQNPSLSQPIGPSGTGIRDFSMPLPSIGLMSIDKNLPLDTSTPITFDFHLASHTNFLLKGTTSATAIPTNYELENVTLDLNVIELTPESNALLEQAVSSTGFVMDYENITHSTYTKAAAVNSTTQTLGTRVSALNRVLVVHRNAANLSDIEQLSLSNRSHGNLSECSLLISGVRYPQISLKHTPQNPTQILSELALFEGDMTSSGASSSLNIPALFDYRGLDVLDGTATNTAASVLQRVFNGSGETVGGVVTNLKAAAIGTNAEAVSHVRPANNTGITAASHSRLPFDRTSNFSVEDGTLAANYKGAQGLTRATSQSSLGKFLIGFQLSTFFENEQIYSNISTVGSHVALDLKYDTSSSDNIVDVYSFYHNILRLDPITRMYSIASQ